MSAGPRRLIARRSLGLVVAVAAAVPACNAPGATAIPATPAAGTAATGAPDQSGPTAFTTTTFSLPFSLTLPTGWKVFEEQTDMFAAYLSSDHETTDVAIDIQLVQKVNVDPCNKGAGTTTGATSAAGLVTWMLAVAPLNGSAGTPVTLVGTKALVVNEAFAGTPCVNAELWPTSGGWLDANERKRYFVLDVSGTRLVATIVSSDAKFDAQVAAGLAVLESLRFTP